MSSDDNLPVILVSAVDTAAALEIIKELIDDDTEPTQSNGVSSHEEDDGDDSGGGGGGGGVVWQLENKYYTARVRLLPCAERARRPPRAGAAHAHLIYLTEDECADCSALARRAAWAGGEGPGGEGPGGEGPGGEGPGGGPRLARGAVRLAAARAAPPPALAAAAHAARYELVALARAPAAAPAPAPAGPFPELRGAARLREALHAHAWPGLRLRGAASPPRAEEDSSAESSSDESWGSWRRAGDARGEDEAGAVERAEQFAAALALLPAAAAARGEAAGRGAAGRGAAGRAAPGGAAEDAERRLRAEQLVAAFCRALGHDLAGGGTE